jgi:5-methylcytosine-specific restriction enzyme subunit McrC
VTREIDLEEYMRSEPHELSVDERDALRLALPSLTIQPVPGTDRAYHLTPGSIVGAVEIESLSVIVRPKIGIPQLLSLVCYAMSKFRPQDELFDYPQHYGLPDVLALAFVSAARRAFPNGLLHGYRTEEEALNTVRGRIRFDEQVRRRFGVAPPVEVRYDEFTEDILANQLVKAAAYRLARMRLRFPAARSRLAWVADMVDSVSLMAFTPNAVPEVRFDRLNEHYREVVSLSRLILRHSAFESGRGNVRASGFLIDINAVFQEFVTEALRQALGVSSRQFRERPIPSLDEGNRVHLRPDLTWWDGTSCIFVGDAKYKNVSTGPVPNSDLYQLLAYVTALDLPGGLLIYAKGEADVSAYRSRYSGKRLEVAALDLSGTLDEALHRVRHLANGVKQLSAEAKARQLVA